MREGFLHQILRSGIGNCFVNEQGRQRRRRRSNLPNWLAVFSFSRHELIAERPGRLIVLLQYDNRLL